MLSTSLLLPLLLPASVPAAGDLELVVVNLGLPAGPYLLEDRVLSMRIDEEQLQSDSNGDGDVTDQVLFVYDLAAGVLHETGVAVGPPQGGVPFAKSLGERVYFTVPEGPQGADLNGDGDQSDRVLHSYDVSTEQFVNFVTACDHVVPTPLGVVYVVSEFEQSGLDANGDGDAVDDILGTAELDGTSNGLGLATSTWFDQPPKTSERWALAVVLESSQAQDLNGDGDTLDNVVHVHDLLTGTTNNTGLASGGLLANNSVVTPIGDLAVLLVDEGSHGRDLTGDGDTDDAPSVVLDLGTGMARVLSVSAERMVAEGSRALLAVRETFDGVDRNGDGDALDLVAATFDGRTGDFEFLELAINPEGMAVDSGLAIFRVRESGQGETDLDGDGFANDLVWHAYSFETGVVENLRTDMVQPSFSEGQVGYRVLESAFGVDLNGDGDQFDRIARAYVGGSDQVVDSALDTTTSTPQLLAGHLVFQTSEPDNAGIDLNGDGDGDDDVFVAIDLATGEHSTLPLPNGFFSFQAQGSALAFAVHEDVDGVDLNGDGDALDEVLHVARVQ